MSGTGTLTLSFADVSGRKPKDHVDIFLKHTVLSDAPVVRNHNASKDLQIKNLTSTHGGTYSLAVFPSAYQTSSRFIKINEDQDTLLNLSLAILPNKVGSVKFPLYASLSSNLDNILKNSDVEGFAGIQGEQLYQALDDISRAGLLNIATKMQYTTFSNNRSAIDYVNSLTRLRGDRFFAKVDKEFRDVVKNSISGGLFHEVSGGLHTPPPNFQSAGSFKTQERYGNLQLTFFSNPQTLDFIIDADIDDAQGIEHIFQVLGNLGGGSTHPYNIHDILIGFQHIDPRYSFVL